MDNEQWRDVPGFEGRYQVSDMGRVRSVPFLQRYLLRNGREAFRRTRERMLAQQVQNSGYALVHLHLNGVRKALTVHRLVATVFEPNPRGLPEVNHKDTNKANNRATNLGWATESENHLHAIEHGCNPAARRVSAPSGRTYPSITQAARGERVTHRTAARWAV